MVSFPQKVKNKNYFNSFLEKNFLFYFILCKIVPVPNEYSCGKVVITEL